MSDRIEEAVRALLQYEQSDFDGIIVKASRQAIHEVVEALATRDDEIERLKAVAVAASDYLKATLAISQELGGEGQTNRFAAYLRDTLAAQDRLTTTLTQWKEAQHDHADS